MVSGSMLSRRHVRARSGPLAFNLESLELRVLMAAAPPVLQPPVPLLDPATIPQFVNDITPE